MASTNPPPGSWIPRFLSRYENPAPYLSSSLSAQAAPSTPKRDPNAPAPNSIYTPRGRRQASIFLAGLVSVLWAGSMTRRSLAKRHAQAPAAAAMLQGTAPQATMGQGAQVARAVAARQTGEVAGAVVGRGKGIVAETLQAQGGAVRQTSPGTSIGTVASAEGGISRPVGEALSHVTRPGAATASAEEAAAAAAEELNASGPILAVEALFLATANVLAWALLVSGGVLWYADISSMDEMRRAVRGGLGIDGSGRTEQEADEEIEEWFAKVLKRGEERGEVQRYNERGRPR